jgi:hypothetical protein
VIRVSGEKPNFLKTGEINCGDMQNAGVARQAFALSDGGYTACIAAPFELPFPARRRDKSAGFEKRNTPLTNR